MHEKPYCSRNLRKHCFRSQRLRCQDSHDAVERMLAAGAEDGTDAGAGVGVGVDDAEVGAGADAEADVDVVDDLVAAQNQQIEPCACSLQGLEIHRCRHSLLRCGYRHVQDLRAR